MRHTVVTVTEEKGDEVGTVGNEQGTAGLALVAKKKNHHDGFVANPLLIGGAFGKGVDPPIDFHAAECGDVHGFVCQDAESRPFGFDNETVIGHLQIDIVTALGILLELKALSEQPVFLGS